MGDKAEFSLLLSVIVGSGGRALAGRIAAEYVVFKHGLNRGCCCHGGTQPYPGRRGLSERSARGVDGKLMVEAYVGMDGSGGVKSER